MPAYLEQLTLRLAMGAGHLPEEARARHAAFLRRSQAADGGFPGREGGSDLYYTGFGLRGLALVGELDGDPAQRAADFLRTRLAGQAPIVDFFSLLYGAALLETASGIDIYLGQPTDWRDRVAALFESFRRADGGYAKTAEGQSSSTYYSFLVVLAYELIGRAVPQPADLVAFVRSRQRDDGGFVEIGPMKRSGTNPTAAAIGILKVLDAVDDVLRQDVVEFLTEAQSDEGGLLANTRIPVADVLSTFTGTLTLADLGALEAIDLGRARRYVESMQLDEGGFVGGAWDQGTDVEYTFYGLGGLALLHGAKS
jgi:geranylgeranyl transferase type-2 subunit beta